MDDQKEMCIRDGGTWTDVNGTMECVMPEGSMDMPPATESNSEEEVM